MTLSEIELNIENFKQIDWEKIIDRCERKDCSSYYFRFNDAIKEAKDEARVIQDVYEFLKHITSLMLHSESDNKPFRPSFVAANGFRSTMPEDFSDQQLALMKELVPTIQDADLRARIADILWERTRGEKKRDFQIVKLAIKSYLESAQLLEHPEYWPLSFHRIERAFRLALRLGKDNDLLKSVVNHMENLLDKYKPEDQIFFSTKLMRLLQEQRLGDFAKYAELSEKAAISEEKSRQWNSSREWWEITSRWHSLLKNTEEERRIKVIIAETYVNQANVAISNPSPSYRIAASCIQKAIEAYRQVGGMKDRVEELHKLLLKYQPLSMSEMKVFTHEINVGPITEYEYAIAQVLRGKSFKDSIFQLASMCASPSLENLKSEVEKGFCDYPLQFLFGETLYNQSGKVVAQKQSIISSSPEENKTVFNKEVFQIHIVKSAIYRQQTYGSIIVDYARYQISLEHNVSIKDFDFIVKNNPFIRPGREKIYARGLLEGLKGDFLISTHLLTPQIEDSIRYLMEQRGYIASKLNDQGIQSEHNINSLIREKETELIEILGEDIVFDLKVLLVHIDGFGTNLRNRMAHGFIGDNEFCSGENVYLWGLTLYLLDNFSQTIQR